MAAATADRDDKRRDDLSLDFPLAAVKVYKGTLLSVNSAGYATPATDTAGETVIGVAEETVDNSGGAAGDENVRVYRTGSFELAYGAGDADQADVGQLVYVTDDQTVDLAAVPVNDVLVGRVTEVVDTSTVRVALLASTS